MPFLQLPIENTEHKGVDLLSRRSKWREAKQSKMRQEGCKRGDDERFLLADDHESFRVNGVKNEVS